MRKDGMLVVNPIATNSVNLCALSLAETSEVDDSSYFCITSTARLVYNSCAIKVSSVSVLSACMDIARRELDEFYVSNAVGTRSNVLIDVCRSILGEKDLDAVWCSWVLVNYLCSHPRGRDLLRDAGLTDVDIQSAIAFERYGGEEIRRRARQRKSQTDGSRKRCRPSSEAGPSVLVDADMSGAAAKRKRSSRGSVPSVPSDSHSIIEFWHDALQSEDASVLHTLAAHNKRTARDAALSTLAKQAEGTDVGDNAVLQSVSLKSAIKSAKALVSFVGRRVNDIPTMMLCWVKDPSTGKMRTAAGMMRIDKEAASSALHACTLPPVAVRPYKSTKMAIAWSHATKKLIPNTEESAALPGLLERYAQMKELEDADSKRANGRTGKYSFSSKAMHDIGNLERFVDTESEMAIPRHVTGTTRSFISACTFMCINYTHEHAGKSLVDELKKLHSKEVSINAPKLKLPQILKKSQKSEFRSEPLCTPSSPLAVGICANEMLRRWMAGKTRKNDPCKKHLGFSSPSEVSKEMPGIMSSEPLALLTITDIEIERVGEIRRVSPSMGKAPVAMGIHVCGDGATRLPELIDQIWLQAQHLSPQQKMQEARAALFTAASQASFIGCVASSLTSGYTNASVASSKKISVRCALELIRTTHTLYSHTLSERCPSVCVCQVPDVNKIMLLSPFDCYVAGICNIQRSFDPGPYSGTYGCRVDTGFTMHGLLAHNFRSDKRQHGNASLTEAAADELALAFGESHWVVYDDPAGGKEGDPPIKYYTSAPTATRGIPHNFTPGIHSLLNDYCSFIETCRSLTGREHCDTVDNIMCLPFSPFTQALNPDVEPTADVSLRTCFRKQVEASVSTGRAYLPDATSEDEAIVKEPLFRRPCQVSSGDCPFATAYEAVDTFFNACNTLALLARACTMQRHTHPTASQCVAHIHCAITNFVSEYSTASSDLDSSWAADALVLINVLYPSNLAIGELALLNGISKAAPACHRGLAGGSPVAHIDKVATLDAVDVRLVRMFWSSFCRDDSTACAWKWGLAPFLTLILNHNGSHDTTPETTAQFRSCLENAVRAVWLVYSPDGVAPPPADHPAHDATSPMQVARHHIDPVFVGNQETGLLQRACTIGMKPHSYRQVLTELLGVKIAEVQCNVALNEGGMGLRVSSDPTILNEYGNERTYKSISPVQTEGDESAYGKRRDKLAGAIAQKYAWDCNALLCKPLYTAIEPPRNAEIRSRGEFGFSQFFQAEHAKMAKDGQMMSSSFATAKAMMREASNPAVSNIVNGVL